MQVTRERQRTRRASSAAGRVRLRMEAPHATPGERTSMGDAARAEVPHELQGVWEPGSGRADPVELLERQSATRVPELVPIRYGRMVATPFTFYRGAAAVMAADLAVMAQSGLRAQLCGDAHLANFGGYAAPDRQMVFDINDFDETLPGPWEWDVKRLAASFAVAGRERGFSAGKRRTILLNGVGQYRRAMRQFAQLGNLAVWYARLDVGAIIQGWGGEASAKQVKGLHKTVSKAKSKDSLRALAKLTELVDGQPRIINDPPLLVPIKDLSLATKDPDRIADVVKATLDSYRGSLPGDRRHLLESYRVVDLAHKVVGVGSVGTRCFIALLIGRDQDDPLFLQVKEADASVLEPHVSASAYPNHGQRVVEGQRLMQAAGDIFLGWDRSPGLDGVAHDHYVRQLWDWKRAVDIESMTPSSMGIYGEICNWTLARAHARSGDRVAIAAYLGDTDSFDRAIADFAEAYADQNERDHAVLVDAVRTGRVKAQEGV
jgi:uncharacterized protein (DUF2252 family)